MINLKDISSNLPFDITAEALAGLVMDSNEQLLTEQFRIQGTRHLSKVAGREVAEVSLSGFDEKGRELIHLDVNRRSLFDALPEMLFHSGETFNDDVEQAQFIARERENARGFFIPFEEELYRSRIEVERNEHAFLKELNIKVFPIFDWELEALTPEEQNQLRAFGLFLPFLNSITGHLEIICVVLKTVLNKTITVKERRAPAWKLPASLQSRLGQADLGNGFVVGDTFSDGARQLEFSISGVEAAELEDWIPGGKKRKMLEEKFFPCLLAAGENYTINILLNNPKEMVLGDEGCSNILGYAII